MQRLVEKIQSELAHNTDYIEINALDGNGDSFQVYQGKITGLTSFHFENILRFPGCFYFFNVSSIPNIPSQDAEDVVIRRDICWLTDPLPPDVVTKSHSEIKVKWSTVTFCGVSVQTALDSVSYTLQVAEGVDWKSNLASKFINDAGAVDYKTVCNGPYLNSMTITGLKPAKWYHLRLIIEYLGSKVTSETSSIYTNPSCPSAPGKPRMLVVPVRNSFDLRTDLPARLELQFTWYASALNGSAITKYQLQIQRFDVFGNVIPSAEVVHKKQQRLAQLSQQPIFESPELGPITNQWVKSPGKNAQQIHNSLVLSDYGRSNISSVNSRSRSRSPPKNESRNKNNAHNNKEKKKNSNSHRDRKNSSNNNNDTTSLSLIDRNNNNNNYNNISSNNSINGGVHFDANYSDTNNHQNNDNNNNNNQHGHYDYPPEERRYKWEILFENLSTSAKCSSPGEEEAEWHLRVRACNVHGWSEFSELLKMNALTHPALFTPSPPAQARGSYYYQEATARGSVEYLIPSVSLVAASGKQTDDKNASYSHINGLDRHQRTITVPSASNNNNLNNNNSSSISAFSPARLSGISNNSNNNNNIPSTFSPAAAMASSYKQQQQQQQHNFTTNTEVTTRSTMPLNYKASTNNLLSKSRKSSPVPTTTTTAITSGGGGMNDGYNNSNRRSNFSPTKKFQEMLKKRDPPPLVTTTTTATSSTTVGGNSNNNSNNNNNNGSNNNNRSRATTPKEEGENQRNNSNYTTTATNNTRNNNSLNKNLNNSMENINNYSDSTLLPTLSARRPRSSAPSGSSSGNNHNQTHHNDSLPKV